MHIHIYMHKKYVHYIAVSLRNNRNDDSHYCTSIQKCINTELWDIYALSGIVQECNHNNDRGTRGLVSNYGTSHHCKTQIHETTDRKLHKERKA